MNVQSNGIPLMQCSLVYNVWNISIRVYYLLHPHNPVFDSFELYIASNVYVLCCFCHPSFIQMWVAINTIIMPIITDRKNKKYCYYVWLCLLWLFMIWFSWIYKAYTFMWNLHHINAVLCTLRRTWGYHCFVGQEGWGRWSGQQRVDIIISGQTSEDKQQWQY